LGNGLQNKSINELEKDLNLPSSQLLALLNKIVEKFVNLFEDMKVRELSGCLNDKNIEAQSQKIKGMVPIK
jgi:N-acetyltransferase 10